MLEYEVTLPAGATPLGDGSTRCPEQPRPDDRHLFLPRAPWVGGFACAYGCGATAVRRHVAPAPEAGGGE